MYWIDLGGLVMNLVNTVGDIMRSVGAQQSISESLRPKPLFDPRMVHLWRL